MADNIPAGTDAGKEHMPAENDRDNNKPRLSLSHRAPAGRTTTKTTYRRYQTSQVQGELGASLNVGVEWKGEMQISHGECIRAKTDVTVTYDIQPTIEHLGGMVDLQQPGGTRTAAAPLSAPIGTVYVTIGIFGRGHMVNPRESIVIMDRENFFRQLRWGAVRLRGIAGTLLSLRHVKEFKLYRCNPELETHKRVDLDSNGVTDLKLLFDNYNKWRVPDAISRDWADWVHKTLNNESLDVRKGSYSLELVLDWSATRITIVVFLPVLLSLAVGIWLNSANWTDLATIQTAWGTASYIVTAGGFTAALLGILSSIGDK